MAGTELDPVVFLMRVHYGFFMSNPGFWYHTNLREADAIICALASEIRHDAHVLAMPHGRQ